MFEGNYINFFRDSIFIMIAWWFMAISFFAWGDCVCKFFKFCFMRNLNCFIKIWLGWVASIFLGAVYHLFFPINIWASCLFYLPGFIYFFMLFGKKLPKFIKDIGWLKIIILLVTAFAVATITIQIPNNFDTGLYHLNSIRWANEYHIIKGIGNLHTRLGFNQLYFLYAASLNLHPLLNDYAFHIANSFLYILFAISMILSGQFIDYLLLCLLFAIPMPFHWINNPTPDFASTLLQLSIFRIFIEAVFYKKPNKIHYISVAAILACVMVTIKLSNSMFALGLGIIALVFSKELFPEIEAKKIIRSTVVFVLLFFVLWIIRGYIQTGYPLFPISFGKLNTDWTVPTEIAKKIENTVYAGTKSCERTFDINSPYIKGWNWVDYWFKRHFFDKEQYFDDYDFFTNVYLILTLIFFPITYFNWGISSLLLFCSSLALLAFLIIKSIKNSHLFIQSKLLWAIVCVDLLSIAFWFLVAPSPRFSNGIFIILFLSCLLLLKSIYSKIIVSSTIKNILLVYYIVMLISGFYSCLSVGYFSIDGIQKLKKVQMQELVTNHGLKVFFPKNNVQSWDSELLSTPEPRLSLSLRGNEISDGFKIIEVKNNN